MDRFYFTGIDKAKHRMYTKIKINLSHNPEGITQVAGQNETAADKKDLAKLRICLPSQEI